MNSLTQQNKEYYEYKQIFLECEILAERIASCEKNVTVSKGIIQQYVSEESKLSQLIYGKKQILSIAEKRNFLINFFKGTWPKKLKVIIANLNNKKMKMSQRRIEAEKRLRLLTDELEKLNTVFSKKTENLPEGIKTEHIENVLRET